MSRSCHFWRANSTFGILRPMFEENEQKFLHTSERIEDIALQWVILYHRCLALPIDERNAHLNAFLREFGDPLCVYTAIAIYLIPMLESSSLGKHQLLEQYEIKEDFQTFLDGIEHIIGFISTKE